MRSSACTSGKQTEQYESHFGNSCFLCVLKKKEEVAAEENMDPVKAREKRPILQRELEVSS